MRQRINQNTIGTVSSEMSVVITTIDAAALGLGDIFR